MNWFLVGFLINFIITTVGYIILPKLNYDSQVRIVRIFRSGKFADSVLGAIAISLLVFTIIEKILRYQGQVIGDDIYYGGFLGFVFSTALAYDDKPE